MRRSPYQSLLIRAGHWLTHSVSIIVKFNEYAGLQQDTGRAMREAVERSSSNRPPPARVWAPSRGAAGGPKNTHFRLFSYHNQGSKLYWPGVDTVIYAEKMKKKNPTKIHASCGDDVTFFMLVFAEVHYKSF